jgi:hypothetical protein
MTDHAQRAHALIQRLADVRAAYPGDRVSEFDVIEAALTQAHAAGRRDGLEEAQRKVQSLCNKETHCYIQDKTGCNHPDVEVVHNGNAARVADDFRIWCRAKAKEGE